ARPGVEAQLGGGLLAVAGDVPRLQAQPGQHVADLLLGRRVVQVAAYGVARLLGVEDRQGGAALGAVGVDPDLDHYGRSVRAKNSALAWASSRSVPSSVEVKVRDPGACKIGRASCRESE